MVGVHFGCAEDGVGVGTGKRTPGGAAAGHRVAMVIGGVNTYHLSATHRGLVVFPRFASVRRTAAAAIGGGCALRPTAFFLQSHRPKTGPSKV
jgi:hypothetical protein